MYQTYLVAFDGNWIAVVSARSASTALRNTVEAFSELGKACDFEVKRVPPGQMHALPKEERG